MSLSVLEKMKQRLELYVQKLYDRSDETRRKLTPRDGLFLPSQ